MKDDKVYLLHILDAINKTESFVLNIDYENFSENELVQSGVMRQLEIIGEAADKLSQKLRNEYRKIPWQDIVGMRHKLIHDYFGVDIEIVWETIKKDLPKLKSDIENILREKP